MEANKIRSKYCTDEKVQVMFSNAPNQIIFSKDGYLYLRHKDITIHRYLTDPLKKQMPYGSNPSSENHATHLFKYDQVYVKSTSNRNISNHQTLYDSSCLSFLYFHKLQNGEALLGEMFLKDFDTSEPETVIMSRNELKRFLYSVYSLDAKCITNSHSAIEYLTSIHEDVTVDNNFLDLSDEGIIKLYNSEMESLHYMGTIFSHSRSQEPHDIWNISSIQELKKWPMVPRGYLASDPNVITISGNDVTVYQVSISYVSEDRFELTKRTTKILQSKVKSTLLSAFANADYPSEPPFDE